MRTKLLAYQDKFKDKFMFKFINLFKDKFKDKTRCRNSRTIHPSICKVVWNPIFRPNLGNGIGSDMVMMIMSLIHMIILLFSNSSRIFWIFVTLKRA